MLLLAVFTTTAACFSQTINNLEIIINPDLKEGNELPYTNQPITWNEFRGKPDNTCGFIAMTYSGIKLKYSYQTRNGVAAAKVEVCPYMDLSQSWYKKEHCNDSTLVHEQRHFDITAIVTRQFIDDLKSRNFTMANFSSEIKKMHHQYLQKLAEMQRQYDGETLHGTIPDKQAAWNQQIFEEVQKAMNNG